MVGKVIDTRYALYDTETGQYWGAREGLFKTERYPKEIRDRLNKWGRKIKLLEVQFVVTKEL